MTHPGFDLAGSLEAAGRQHAEGAVKISEDLARYRAIIAEARPDVVVEMGTFSGRSAIWFARETGAPVITVDVDAGNVSDATRTEAAGHVTFLVGRSTDPRTIREVWRLANGHERPLVVLDSDHSARTVAGELMAYAPLVQPGGYCVVEDTLVRWMPWEQQPDGPYWGSPADAVDEWMRTWASSGWVDDEHIEGMSPVTQHPGGWLRRVR